MPVAFLDELREERKDIALQARDILGRAQEEKRDLTVAEDKELRALRAQGDALTRRIDHEEGVGQLEDRTFLPHRAGIRPDPDADPGEERSAPNLPPAGRRFRSFGEQLSAVMTHAYGRGMDSRLEQRALGANEAVGSDGGFAVQSDFAQEIFKRAYETGQVASRCRKITIGAQFNSTKIPGINESSRVDGSRWGGVQSFWAGEGQTYTASRPKFRLMDLVLKKLIGLAYATDEMLQDSQLLESIIMQAMTEEIAFKCDDGAINGIGGGSMLGIMSSPSLITVAAASGSGARLLSDDVLSMWSRCWGRSRMNAIWFINQDVETQLFKLTLGTATVNQAVYVPPGGLSAAPYATLMGRPVVPIEQCQTLGTPGDIILADMSQYALADKGSVQTAISMHVQFLTDEQVFRFTYRVDGQPYWQLPLTPAHGSNTLSPFVTVATRS